MRYFSETNLLFRFTPPEQFQATSLNTGAFAHLRQLFKILITDGEPADNDVRDPQYLRYDTKRAVEELTRDGITTYALSLDPHADQYVQRIFGAKNFTVLDHVERLPEKLPMLYMGLTR